MDINFFRNTYFLYVDDDAMSRKVMNLLLKNGMGVRDFAILESSTDFMAQVKNLPHIPDVFLLDIHIAPYDGFEMLGMLRADPKFNQSKIIALTASVTSEEVEQMRRSGFNGVIGKPINISTFPEHIQRILKNERVWQI